MVSVHELAPLAPGLTRTDLDPKPRQAIEEVVLVRCPSCQGLRGVSRRHVTRNGGLCVDCRHGRVVPRARFYGYWTIRFTMDEIAEMSKAIWG
jgi:hypothetical protein